MFIPEPKQTYTNQTFPSNTISRNIIFRVDTSSNRLTDRIPTEKEFQQWLARDIDPHEHRDTRRADCLWIIGAEGRGKTSATLAALEEVEKAIQDDEHLASGQSPSLLAYCFCDPSDFSTAEKLLKSLLWQLTQKQPMFLPYAKQFTKREDKTTGKEDKKGIPTSVENLWQSLQDMLSDDTTSSRIYLVINNLHSLSQESESTRKLIDLIKAEMEIMNDSSANRTSVRWLFTSRKAKKNISDLLSIGQPHVIDLEDDRYADRVQLELRKHAQKKVTLLGEEKKYKKDLAYFVSSLIGNRARNTGWIDMTCGQLKELARNGKPAESPTSFEESAPGS